MEWDGKERRRGAIETEHRLTVLDMKTDELFKQVKDVKSEVRIGDYEILETVKEYGNKIEIKIKDLDARISVFEVIKSKVVAIYGAMKWVAGGVATGGGIYAFFYKLIHHGKGQ